MIKNIGLNGALGPKIINMKISFMNIKAMNTEEFINKIFPLDPIIIKAIKNKEFMKIN